MDGTSTSEERPARALAVFLEALRAAGLAVGPDDAGRIAWALDAHHRWPRAKRVRVLQSLLARTEAERAAIDALVPVVEEEEGEKEAEAEEAQAAGGERGAASDSKAGRTVSGPIAAKKRARRWYLALVALIALMLAIGVYRTARTPPAPSAPAGIVQPEEEPEAPDDGGSFHADGPSGVGIAEPASPDLAMPAAPPPEPEKPSPPRWPYAVFFVFSAWLLLRVLRQAFRASRQAANRARLSRSKGETIFTLEPDGRRPLAPIDEEALREAAFVLCAPSEEEQADWLDANATVRATVQRAGRVALRWDRTRRHAPVLFLEDAGGRLTGDDTMARWPAHGPQIARALARQGAEVDHRFFRGDPSRVLRGDDAAAGTPIAQVLAERRFARVVLFSDGAVLARLAAPAQAAAIEALAGAVWIHPQPAELWSTFIRSLAGKVRVVPAGGEALRRVGLPRTDGTEALPAPYVPPSRARTPSALAWRAWEDELGEPVFAWLAAGALVDKEVGLTSALWWAMREEGVTGEPDSLAWERVERVWMVPGLGVRAGGAMVFEEGLREALVAWLSRKEALLGKVVDWVSGRIEAGLAKGAEESLASVQARAARARLAFRVPERKERARGWMKELAAAGLGTWVDGQVEAGERTEWGVALAPVGPPDGRAWVAGILGVLGMLASVRGWMVPDWWKSPGAVEMADLGQWDMAEKGPDLAVWDSGERADLAVSDMSHKPPPRRRRDMTVVREEVAVEDMAPQPALAGPDMLPPPERPDMARRKDYLPRMKRLGKFEIGYTEVTQAQYEAVMGKNPSSFTECGPNCPVEQVSRDDAVAYCNKLSAMEGLTPCYEGDEWRRDCTGYRLPTREEWEYAARGGKKDEEYAGTNDEKEVCKYGNVSDATAKANGDPEPFFECDDGFWHTAPVGHFRPNGFGLYDMTGNVYEWTWDKDGESRVLRGGSWYSSPRNARVALRYGWRPSDRNDDVGFRVSRSLP